MIKNYFYLIAGVLFIILAVTHTIFGLGTALPALHDSGISADIATVFTFQLHMIGVQDLIYGLAAVFMAFQKSAERTRLAAWIIMLIMAARWIVMAIVTFMYNAGELADLLTSSIAFLVLLVLLFLGQRVNVKSGRTA